MYSISTDFFLAIESYNHYKKDMRLIMQNISNNSDFPEKSVKDINENDTQVILTLNVLDFIPKDLTEFSQLYCSTCKER